MRSRRYFGHIKSLLHFDFPYYHTGTSSLKSSVGAWDDASPEFWEYNGKAKLDGSIGRDYSVPSGSPKFGWKSLQTASSSDYIAGSNSAGTFALSPNSNSEIECFIQPVDATAGNIVAFMNGNTSVFSISRETSGKIRLTCSAWNLNALGSAEISTNSWHHLRIRITDNTAYLFVDGVQCLNAALTPGGYLNITECRIGGFNGYIDEFVFRDAIDSTNTVPSAAYKARLDISAMGGWGDGRHGTLNVKSGVKQRINAYTSIASGKSGSSEITRTADGWHSVIGTPGEGDELLILIQAKGADTPDELAGRYAFRHILSTSGNNIILDSPLDDDFSLTEALRDYRVYLIHIPNYSSVNIESGGQLLGQFQGLCAFRCTGNVTVSGCIAPYGNSAVLKKDNVLLTPESLPDRFIMSNGGGVMAFCGGKFKVNDGGIVGKTPEAHANSAGIGRGGKGGGNGDNILGGIMRGGYATDGTPPNWKNHGPIILIAANQICSEASYISGGGINGTGNSSPGQYSGLVYFAGTFVDA